MLQMIMMKSKIYTILLNLFEKTFKYQSELSLPNLCYNKHVTLYKNKNIINYIDNHEIFSDKLNFGKLCNKYNYKFTPKTFVIENKNDLNNIKLSPDELYFFKYKYGSGSKCVYSDYGKNLDTIKLFYPFVIQQNINSYNKEPDNSISKYTARVYMLLVMYKKKLFLFINDKGHFNKSFADTDIVRFGGEKNRDNLININDYSIKWNNFLVAMKSFKKILKKEIPINNKKRFMIFAIDLLFDDNYPYIIEINNNPGNLHKHFWPKYLRNTPLGSRQINVCLSDLNYYILLPMMQDANIDINNTGSWIHVSRKDNLLEKSDG